MATGRAWTNICPECGRCVEILNGDVAFSMEVHKQSHKSLNYVNTIIDKNLNHPVEKVDSATKLNLNYCSSCGEHFDIINNDLRLSFQLHSQKHLKPDNSDALSDHSSTSSGKSRESQNMTKEKKEAQPVLSSILDAIFHSMPTSSGLKAHHGFISEQSCSKAICNLCEITIDPIFNVSAHLKTKLHEDNTIKVIKAILPLELPDQMEFISFYGSNLCCNLCRFKIDLCSENLHKTAVNIFAHNAGKEHLSKKTDNFENNHKSHVIVKSLALIDPIVNSNQHFIEHKMHPYFKCKPCDKQIAYSENQNEMISNFSNHFNSTGHGKSVAAESVLNKWKSLNIAGTEKHNLISSKQSIYCLSCNSSIEPNLDKLLAHARGNSSSFGSVQSKEIPGIQNNSFNLKTANSCSFTEPNLKDSPEEHMNNAPIGQFQAKGNYSSYGTNKSEDMPGMQSNSFNFKTTNSCSFTEPNLKSSPDEHVNKGPIGQSQTQEPSTKFKRLLITLPAQFRNVVIENKKGDAECSICNCIIPPTTYNLTTHLNGSSHKKKQSETKLSEKGVNNSQPTQPKAPKATQPKEAVVNSDTQFDLLARSNRLIGVNKEHFVRFNDENNYICLLCGTIIPPDVDFFQRNLLSHIESQDHAYKMKLKEDMSQLLPRHSDALVIDLFDDIPMNFQREMMYIKAPEGMNFVFCVACYIKIPKHPNCLLEHLDSIYHKTSVERIVNIHSKKLNGAQANDCDALFKELVRTNKEIKLSSKYLEMKNEDYLCKLCNIAIKGDKNLKGNLLGHINGKRHKKNVEDEFKHMLDKVQLSSAVVKTNRKFLEKVKGNVLCTLCSCQMSFADSVEALTNSLEVHFLGSSHKAKVESQTSFSISEQTYNNVPPMLLQQMESQNTAGYGVLGYYDGNRSLNPPLNKF